MFSTTDTIFHSWHFPQIYWTKNQKDAFLVKNKNLKKKNFSPTMAWYTLPPMLAKSQNLALLTCSNYIQTWSIWYFFQITQVFRGSTFDRFQFQCSGAETRLASYQDRNISEFLGSWQTPSYLSITYIGCMQT